MHFTFVYPSLAFTWSVLSLSPAAWCRDSPSTCITDNIGTVVGMGGRVVITGGLTTNGVGTEGSVDDDAPLVRAMLNWLTCCASCANWLLCEQSPMFGCILTCITMPLPETECSSGLP